MVYLSVSLIILLVLCPSNFTLDSCQVTPVRLLPDDEPLLHATRIPGMKQRRKSKRHPNLKVDDIDFFLLTGTGLYLEV